MVPPSSAGGGGSVSGPSGFDAFEVQRGGGLGHGRMTGTSPVEKKTPEGVGKEEDPWASFNPPPAAPTMTHTANHTTTTSMAPSVSSPNLRTLDPTFANDDFATWDVANQAPALATSSLGGTSGAAAATTTTNNNNSSNNNRSSNNQNNDIYNYSHKNATAPSGRRHAPHASVDAIMSLFDTPAPPQPNANANVAYPAAANAPMATTVHANQSLRRPGRGARPGLDDLLGDFGRLTTNTNTNTNTNTTTTTTRTTTTTARGIALGNDWLMGTESSTSMAPMSPPRQPGAGSETGSKGAGVGVPGTTTGPVSGSGPTWSMASHTHHASGPSPTGKVGKKKNLVEDLPALEPQTWSLQAHRGH